MSWANQSCRCRTAVFAVFAVVWPASTLLGQQTANRQTNEKSRIEQGKQVFERKWTYTERELPPRHEENRADYERRLRTLPGDGLGPMHNADSCESCHARGGSAGVDRNVTLLTLSPRNAFIMSFLRQQRNDRNEAQKTRQKLLDLYPGLLSALGHLEMETVIHEASTRDGYQAIRQRIADSIPDGGRWFHTDGRTSESIRQSPVLSGRFDNIDFYLSQRNSPALFGLGLVDRVPIERLETLAKAQPRRTDGRISGRVGAGKFGWRAQTRSLSEFVSGACANELGLQFRGFPQAADRADATYVSLGQDMTRDSAFALKNFVQSLPPPQQHRPNDLAELLRKGKQIFVWNGCIDCHVENLHPARGIYSDLLLHDMGEGLQSPSPAPVDVQFTASNRLRLPIFPPQRIPLGTENSPTPRFLPSRSSSYFGSMGMRGFLDPGIPVPEPKTRPDEPRFPWDSPVQVATQVKPLSWDALQREWKTTPLWGVADSAPYLHDGRAETLDQAIRLHGGEAAEATENYISQPRENQKLVLLFLASLRAPRESGQPMMNALDPGILVSKGAVPTATPESDLDTLRALAEKVSVFD